MKTKQILLTIIFALILTGCSSNQTGKDEENGTTGVTESLTPTATETVIPTPTTAPEPTAIPTPPAEEFIEISDQQWEEITELAYTYYTPYSEWMSEGNLQLAEW